MELVSAGGEQYSDKGAGGRRSGIRLEPDGFSRQIPKKAKLTRQKKSTKAPIKPVPAPNPKSRWAKKRSEYEYNLDINKSSLGSSKEN